MAEKKFPGPAYNSLIGADPQIIKVPMDIMGIGSRKSMMNKVPSINPGEMSIEHVGGGKRG